MDGNLEFRKVPPKAMYELVQILEISKSWKKLMCIVPKNSNDESLKYTFEHVKRIEDASGYQKRPCAEIFLEEWGTSGKNQPTLNLLLELLQKAELFRAAEYVALQLLKASVPMRPKTGPAADVDVSEKNIQSLIDSKLGKIEQKKATVHDQHHKLLQINYNFTEQPDYLCANENTNTDFQNINKVDEINTDEVSEFSKDDYQRKSVVEAVQHASIIRGLMNIMVEHIPYEELSHCTSNFSDIPFFTDNQCNGHKLGTGAFGSVYYGDLSSMKVAVKRLKSDAVSVEKQFKNEVETLSKYRHENLLPLLSYSCDGPHYCLVYAYMSNGSLQDRLACKSSSSVLSWQERLNIALGTSRGILYLHSAFENPLIHRDVKSANILLDDNLVAKLGDFGLAHLGPSGVSGQSTAQTTTVFGTSVYMAYEAFFGDISVKLDTFSFGVVLLELLTSLSPYDENRKDRDLITHVEDMCDKSIKPLLDYRAGTWLTGNNEDISEAMYLLAFDCLKKKRQNRPEMSVIVEKLENIL